MPWPLIPENVCLFQVHLHPLLGQEHLSAAEPSTSAVELNPQTRRDEALSSLAVPQPLTSLVPQPQLPNQCHVQGHRHSRQVHWGWGCYCWGGWLWGWDWNCFWEPHHRLCQEPFSEATALLLRHSGLCPLRGHGALLPNGGLSHPLCHVTQLSPLHFP